MAEKINKIQMFFQKMKDEKLNICIDDTTYYISKPRTCGNCSFLNIRTGLCGINMPQKINDNYNIDDLENPQNKYRFLPDGLCIKTAKGYYSSYYSHQLRYRLNKFFKFLEDNFNK